MKVLVCGGRDYKNRKRVFEVLDMFQITYVVNGGAHGADRLSTEWAEYRSRPYKCYFADWDKHGRSAGPKRNQDMLDDNPDIRIVIAFPGGAGTQDMIRRAKRLGVDVFQPHSDDFLYLMRHKKALRETTL